MTSPDSGVDQLFRQATDDLHPDVDRLVAGGVERGRARRRRHLAGTAVAALATFGVIGAGVAAVPLLGPDPTGNVPVATDGDGAIATLSPSPTPSGSPSPSGSPTPTPPPSAPAPVAPHLSEPDGPTMAAADIPPRLAELVPGHVVSGPLTQHPYPLVDEADEKIVHFHVDGMLTTVIIGRASASIAHDCTDESVVECRTLADGTVVQLPKPSTADQVTLRAVLAIGDTWMVDVLSYNAAEGKDVAPTQPEPPLSEDELVALAVSGAWFE